MSFSQHNKLFRINDWTGPSSRRALLWSASLAIILHTVVANNTYGSTPPGIQRLPETQFLAALGDPKASSGTIPTARPWGLWVVDPGVRGVTLGEYHDHVSKDWKFNVNDWWLEEHGLIMESPDYDAVRPGRYLVTGGRSVTTVMTIHKRSGSDELHWNLKEGTLYDVTHLPCRSARYRPAGSASCSPAAARPSDFPVTPGAKMPPVKGCDKQDYAVIFLIGIEDNVDGNTV